MVKLRLARYGKRNNPVYRIVAIEHRNKNQGKALEILGFWHPSAGLKEINKKAIESWVQKGAQMTPAVQKLIQ